MSDKNEFSIPVRVYIEDTDAGGIVFYVNYLKYMERARTELLRSLGFAKPAMIDDGLLLVVASAKIDYKRPATLDETLRATAKITKLARTYVLFEQNIFNDNEQLLSSAIIKVACVEQKKMKPSALPGNVSDAVNSWMTIE